MQWPQDLASFYANSCSCSNLTLRSYPVHGCNFLVGNDIETAVQIIRKASLMTPSSMEGSKLDTSTLSSHRCLRFEGESATCERFIFLGNSGIATLV